MIYMLEFFTINILKIGITHDIESRLRNHSSETGPLYVHALLAGNDLDSEFRVSSRFVNWHIKGELFTSCEASLQFMMSYDSCPKLKHLIPFLNDKFAPKSSLLQRKYRVGNHVGKPTKVILSSGLEFSSDREMERVMGVSYSYVAKNLARGKTYDQIWHMGLALRK